MKWSAPVGGGSVKNYRIQVSTSSDFSSTVFDESNITGNSYEAKNLEKLTTYYWRVSASNDGGTGSWSEVWSFVTEPPLGVEDGNPSIGFTLNSVTPNPAQSATAVNFTTATTAHNVNLTIYSVTGQQVYSMNESNVASGSYSYNWNTTQIPVGVYVVRLTVDNSVRSTTVSVVK